MRKRAFKIPTSEYLAKAALHYLGRYAASEASLRRVLENRLRRSAMRIPAFAADKDGQENLRRSIDVIIEKHRKSGILNDSAYAETKINSLRRAGRSARVIEQKLGYAGVDKTIIQNILKSGEEDAEIKAAQSLARKKRLGPFRTHRKDENSYRKDLASMARAGFSLAIARQVLKGQGLGDEEDFNQSEDFFSAK